MAGFDGFVDEMIELVDERQSPEAYQVVGQISEFAAEIARGAGKSMLREIIVHRQDAGGCAVNISDGLTALGVTTDCFATLGEPQHKAFAEVGGRCRTFESWACEPGRTLAFEFKDGKVMFSSVQHLNDFKPDVVQRYLEKGAYPQRCHEATVIALTDWTLYPNMTAVWQQLQEQVYSKLSQRPWFFIDLVDPSSRSVADIKAMLIVMQGFSQAGPCILGLNVNEAQLLCRLCELPAVVDTEKGIREASQSLQDALQIEGIVIHSTRWAAVATNDHTASVCGPYCEQPVKLTGAGDRFNAGFCTGLMLEQDLENCLRLAVATSGFFVAHGRSPGWADFLSALQT